MKKLNIVVLFISLMFGYTQAQEIVWGTVANQKAISFFSRAFKPVNDFEKIFTETELISLTSEVNKINKTNRFNVTIVTVSDYNGYGSITDLGKDLLSHWHVGSDKGGEGIIILFSKAKRSVSIINTMEKIPHSETQKVINQIMMPNFGKRNFYNGLLSGAKEYVALRHKYVG